MIRAKCPNMIDATLITRHRAIMLRTAGISRDGWTLSGLPEMGAISLPPALRGNLLTEYEQRRSRTTNRASNEGMEADPLKLGSYEATIARRLGWRSRAGRASYVYWRHIPIMRLEQNGPSPHILISAYHVGSKAQPTRALFAANNVLDYLMTGVRLDMKGVSLAWRHETTPWPKTIHKPAIYIPVRGQAPGEPFWTAKSFEFVERGPLCFEGGMSYPENAPVTMPVRWQDYDVASPLHEQDDPSLDGLV